MARQHLTMLHKGLAEHLEYNKHEVKMERKNPDKISVRLIAFFGCQQQLEIHSIVYMYSISVAACNQGRVCDGV